MLGARARQRLELKVTSTARVIASAPVLDETAHRNMLIMACHWVPGGWEGGYNFTFTYIMVRNPGGVDYG